MLHCVFFTYNVSSLPKFSIKLPNSKGKIVLENDRSQMKIYKKKLRKKSGIRIILRLLRRDHNLNCLFFESKKNYKKTKSQQKYKKELKVSHL